MSEGSLGRFQVDDKITSKKSNKEWNNVIGNKLQSIV